MSKLPLKLKIAKIKRGLRNKHIAAYTGASLQSVLHWCNEARCPAQITKLYAEKLCELFEGEITIKDCGY